MDGSETAYPPHGAARAIGQASRRLLDLVYPPLCPLTGDAVTMHGAFSPAAWGRAQMIAPPWCQACGQPFALTDAAAPLCVPCASTGRFPGRLTGKGRLDRLRSALRYDDESAPLILSLKYGDRHDTVPALARLLLRAGEELLEPGVILVPVPLHRRRLGTRRYNQSALLTGALAGLTGLRHAPRFLVRTRPTPKQKGLSSAARRRNVAGAFAARQPAERARIVLVDDVLTSGATLLACARALRRAGAADVSALTLARVVRD